MLCKDNVGKTYITLLKHGSINTSLCVQHLDSLLDWWNAFSVNQISVDPWIIESKYSDFGYPLTKIKNLQYTQIMDKRHMMDVFIKEHCQWLVKMKIIVQNI